MSPEAQNTDFENDPTLNRRAARPADLFSSEEPSPVNNGRDALSPGHPLSDRPNDPPSGNESDAPFEDGPVDRNLPDDQNMDDDEKPESFDMSPLASAPNIGKSAQVLDLMFNTEKSANEKSIWQFFLNEVVNLPTVDDLAAAWESQGRSVNMDQIHFEWYGRILQKYKRYLQEAFGEPLDLDAFGRRISNFQISKKRLMQECHYEWTDKYRSWVAAGQHTVKKSSDETGSENKKITLEDRKKQALDKRRAALAARI